MINLKYIIYILILKLKSTKIFYKILYKIIVSMTSKFIEKYEKYGEKSFTNNDLRNLCLSLKAKPLPGDFWLLSKAINILGLNLYISDIDLIYNVLLDNCSVFLSAAFASAHFIRKLCGTNIEICKNLLGRLKLPTNPIECSYYIRLLCENVHVEKISRLIDFPDEVVQKNVAYAISRCCVDKRGEIMKILDKIPNESNYYSVRGLIYTLECLIDNDIPLFRCTNVLLPILENKSEYSLQFMLACCEIQKLLSRIIRSNMSLFHSINVFDAVINQFNLKNLESKFLDSVLLCYGKYAVRKLTQPVLNEVISNNVNFDKNILNSFRPYVKFLDINIQSKYFYSLVVSCEKNNFDIDLLYLTAKSFISIAPVVSQYLGRFVTCLHNLPCNREIMSILRPLLEPVSSSYLQSLSGIVFVLPEDKREIKIQTYVDTCDMITQTEEVKE